MSNEFVLSDKVQKQLDALQLQIDKYQMAITKLEREKDKLEAGQSPIKIGDKIKWWGGGKERRERQGIVVSIGARYDGYEYRCDVLNKSGKVVGTALVHLSQEPELL